MSDAGDPEATLVAQASEAHVAQLRRKLLDLRTSNRLIHFPHAERSRGYVRVIDEVPELLFDKLADGKPLRIVALPEPAPATPNSAPTSVEDAARALGISPDFALPRPGEQTLRRHADDAIQTLLFPEAHQKTLQKIAEATRSMQEEQGIHTLFAAFGFLEWSEQKDSQVPRFAPLVLYPLTLERTRKLASYEYAVSAHDEERSINLALAERLELDFNLSLPDFHEDDDLGSYFARLEPLIAAMPGWKLHRWVTLTNLSFARIAMYQDLAPERWPGGQTPDTHPTFRALTVDRRQEHSQHVESDPEHLAVIADELSSLILDADTSQVAAILEAFKDRNLVIKGPPGTGKSQTIANLIATALQRDMRVLFVAEKMAALEVVKARLDRAGLGAFCLELHSHRATRKAVMASIAERLEVSYLPEHDHETDRARSREARRRLNAYAAQLNATHGSLGHSVHTLIWLREAARRALSDHAPLLDKLSLPGVREIKPGDADSVRHTLRGFQQASLDHQSSFAAEPRSLWRGIERADLDEAQLLAQLEAYQRQLTNLRDATRQQLGETSEQALGAEQVRALFSWSQALPATRTLHATLLSNLESADTQKTLLGVLEVLARERALSAELGRDCARLDDARASLETLRGAAKGLVTHPTEATLVELRAQAEASRARCDELTSASHKLTPLLRFAGIEGTDDPDAVLAFHEALGLLEQAPRALLHALRVSPALLDEALADKLHTLHDDARKLRERRAKLDQRIVRAQHEPELRERGADYALALQRPWWLAWLFGLYWTARSLHRRIAVQPGSKARHMSEDLLEASRLLHALDSYHTSSEARSLLGSAFVGADTDFDTLQQAAAWARTVNSRLGRLHVAYPPLRQLLLRNELTQVTTLLNETRELPVAALAQLAGRAQRFRLTLTEAIESDRKQAQQTLLSVTSFEQVGADGALNVGGLAGLLTRLDELVRIDQQLPALTATLARFGIVEPLSSLDLAALHDTVSAAVWASQASVPTTLLSALATPAGRARFSSELEPALAREASSRELLAQRGLPTSAWQVLGTSFAAALPALEHALSTRPLLRAQLHYLREQSRAASSFAGPVVKACARGALPIDKLLFASDYLLYHALILHAYAQTPELARGNGSELESVRAQYAALDRSVLTQNARALASKLSRIAAPEGIASGKKSEWSELSLIKHELSKRMRHVPLRQLMVRAGKALGALKPCFMMSPLSVAQYLPQLADSFDLVVIDEASQMRPEDAMGALVRARHAVVVGDPRQLPPTSFFQRGESSSDDDATDDEPVDAESILDLGLSSFGASTDLRWHYRSRHPSLIAFSNEHFYEGRLKVFPAPSDDRSELGVELVRVEGAYAASINQLEAQAIAGRVLHHVHHRPERSLGVAAMNQKQKDLILEEIAKLDDERVRAFVDAEQPTSGQPFFVKSLENVQGDERDVIFVSLTYGPEPVSKRVFQRFGPLNSEYGARRLNVLLTRARQQLVVFSSLEPEDIIVDERSSAGLKSLRSYLVYAETGQLAPSARSGGATDSPFEDAVRALLVEAGYEAVPQVGVQGFFIDLGVRKPGQKRFLCGIECDGAAYHSSRSARDRDRLRQEILEAQGWNIVRVWSTDWFREPKLARERLLAQLAALATAS